MTNVYTPGGVNGIKVLSEESNYQFAIVDANDNVLLGVIDGALFGSWAIPELLDLAARDAANIAAARTYADVINTTSAQNFWDWNVKILNGQSLASAQEAWPALSKTALYGNLMFGGSVRPSNETGASYTPFGSATMQGMIANVNDAGAILSDGAVAALPAGNGALGEAPIVGAVNFAKKLYNRHRIVPNDAAKVFIAAVTAVAGTTIEQLSKVNTQDAINRYARNTAALTQIKALADAAGKSIGVPSIHWEHGQWNYASHGGSWAKAAYKTALATLIADLRADLSAITGQATPPAWLMTTTDGSFTRDVDSAGVPGLHIAEAQWETSREVANCFIVGPSYYVTDKGGHLDSNGSRWLGNQFGKVDHIVTTLGRNWRPLSPRRITYSGRTVYADFHVPFPPLVFSMPYLLSAATDYPDKGFKVTDILGTVPIDSVDIVGQTIVRITTDRDIAGDGYLWYADKTVHNGNGCLRDSDPTVAHDNYEYQAGTGMYVAANIAALVGKPYPLHNWCIPFYRPLTYSE